MRLKHTVRVNVGRTTDMKDMWFSMDEQTSEKIIDTMTKHVSGDFKIGAGLSETLSLGDIDAVKGIYVEAASDCTVKINGSTDAIQLRRQKDYAKLFLEADITSIEITAGATDDLTGVYCAWGDLSS